MEINKQLFENVLSGKLKGVFVLRNGHKFNSTELRIDYNFAMPYVIRGFEFFETGRRFPKGNSDIDIVDFIPDTDMKENELTIEIPNDKVVDWEESKKQNKIVLKDKQLTYEDVCEKLFKDREIFFTGKCGDIENATYSQIEGCIYDKNNATTEHQLKCILAKNKLANVATFLNDGWKPSKTNFGQFDAWVLFATPDKDHIGYLRITDCTHNSNALFKSPELAQQAIKILGEETVKLALEPLGI